MLILLPPSESKATRARGASLRWDGLSAPELTDARQQVAEALAAASERIDAPVVLSVSAAEAPAEVSRLSSSTTTVYVRTPVRPLPPAAGVTGCGPSTPVRRRRR